MSREFRGVGPDFEFESVTEGHPGCAIEAVGLVELGRELNAGRAPGDVQAVHDGSVLQETQAVEKTGRSF